MTQAIIDALAKLDVNNDNHWTGDGMPRIETVRMLAGNQQLSREAITQASHGFCRATALDNKSDSTATTTATTGTENPAAAAQVGSVTSTDSQTQLEQMESEWHDEILELENETDPLKKAQGELDLLRKAKARVDALFAEKTIEVDALLVSAESPAEPLHQTLDGYFAQQERERKNRASALVELEKTGKSLAELSAQLVAPVDALRKRK